MFWQTKNVEITSEERINRLEKRLIRAESEILDLNVTVDSLRNKVLRKIQRKHEEEETEEPKDLYNSMLIKEK